MIDCVQKNFVGKYTQCLQDLSVVAIGFKNIGDRYIIGT